MKKIPCGLILLVYSISTVFATTKDTIRSIRALMPLESEAYADISLACPDIELPSILGPKSSFRYIDAGCETSLTIRPNFGVSGGQITGYNVYSIPYAPPFPFNMGTKVFIDLDDIWGDVIQLPFKFCFFENTYSQAVVGANGLISFNTSVANKYSGWSVEGKKNIPDKAFLGQEGLNWGNAIYGVFEDIDPKKITSQHTNGSIRYGMLGTYPCRTLTVSWDKVPNFHCASGNKYWDSFQIVLYEGTNVIDVYVNHKSRCTSWNIGRGIIGIQNKTCTKAYAAPHRNTEDSWAADREAWRFAPISTPQYTITYYAGMGINGQMLGQGEQITIDPTKIDAITARLQFTAANGDKFDIRDTAVIVRTEVQHVVTNKTICEAGSYEWRGKIYTQSGTYEEGMGWLNGCYDKIYQLNLSLNNQKGSKEEKKLCRGETYIWKGTTYAQSGTYYYRKRYPDGCETIDTLILTVSEQYHFTQYDTICNGNNYVWHGKTYTNTGTYEAKYQTVTGCDSIYRLYLVVGEKYLFSQKVKVCEGEVYKWRGRTYKDAGVYYDSLVSSLGCDSVYQLELSIAPKYKIEEFDTICRGETYTWHGNPYSEAGIYYDNLKSSDGCDSIHVLHLHVNKTYLFVEENGIRSDGKYRWRDQLFTSPGQYYDSLKTKDGCDSVYQLNLTYIRSQLYTHTKYICEGEAYTWRRKTYTETGVYYDSLKNVNGADSVYQLNLTVGVPLYVKEEVSICAGETYEWRGKSYSVAAVYTDVEPRKDNDCGATYQLDLTVGEPFLQITNKTICAGDMYSWRGYTYTKPGTYYDEFKTVFGCDSVYQLNLKECKKYLYPTYQTICKGDSYTWRGKQYTETGIYWDSLKTVNQCDSVYKLELTVDESFIQEEYATICDNERYDWHNHVYNQTGTYYDSLLSASGCDSVYILRLNVNPTYHNKTKATICEKENYTWRDKTYNQTDTYYEYFTTEEGCDSIFSLSLTVMPTYFYREKAYICGGDAYQWHGKLYSEPGVYRDTISSLIGGCDSITELTLGISENYYFEDEYSTCEGSFYSWHGREISESGVYWDSLKTIYGCDSVFKLTIEFHPIHHYITEATICQGENYAWRDSVYAIDSVYYDLYSTTLDCDSIYELRLTVMPTYVTPQTAYICKGDTFIWHGAELTQAGTYVDSLYSKALCDSVVQLKLIENPVYREEFKATINEGFSYTWQNHSYSEAGVYYDSLRSEFGCDSILILYLTVNPRYDYITYDTICDGETYMWQGNHYTESGIYKMSYQTEQGNDSIYELRLTVLPVYHYHQSKNLCTGTIYTWHQMEIHNQGIYYDSLTSVFGCDSIYSIEIQVLPSYHFDIFDTICDEETYKLGDEIFTEGGIYNMVYTTSQGCDSSYTLSLYQLLLPKPQKPIRDVCADDEYIYILCKPIVDSPVEFHMVFNDLAKANGFEDISGYIEDSIIAIPIPQPQDTYILPNTYDGKLTLHGDFCDEQQTYDFSANVLYPNSIIIQKFNDVLAVLNEKYNGGYIFTNYQWYADGQPIPNADMPYYYGSGTLTASYYQVLLTRQSDGVAILTCPIEPLNGEDIDTPLEEASVIPTLVNVTSPIIHIFNQYISEINVYDQEGKLIPYQYVDVSESGATIRMPSQRGIYLLLMNNIRGESKSVKIIIL